MDGTCAGERASQSGRQPADSKRRAALNDLDAAAVRSCSAGGGGTQARTRGIPGHGGMVSLHLAALLAGTFTALADSACERGRAGKRCLFVAST